MNKELYNYSNTMKHFYNKTKAEICFVFVLICLFSGALTGQQQSLHTMFMYNKLLINPAYAGYHEHPCATAIVREQWLGFEGAPKTQSLSFHGPLSSQRIGIGFNLQRRSIGVSS